MSEPKVNRDTAGVLLEWGEEKLTINVARIRSNRDGKISGEITIKTTNEDFKPVLHWSQFNFVSPSERVKLENQLKKKYEEWDWEEIIPQLCYRTIQLLRESETVKRITTEGEIEPLRYFLEPLILLGETNVLFGHGKTGKSYLSMAIYLSGLFPDASAWQNLGLITNGEMMEGLLCDWERGEGVAKRRLQLLEKGLGLPPLFLNYRRCSQTFADDIENIAEAVDKCKAKLIIVDSLAGACGGDLNASEPATRFYNALRSLGDVTSIILAHTQKGNGNEKTIYGSGIFSHRASCVWHIEGHQDEGDNTLDVVLTNQDSNLTGRLEPLSYRFIFGEDKTELKRTELDEAFSHKLSLPKQILGLLKDGKMQPKDIAEALGKSGGDVRKELQRLKNKGLIEKLGEDYGLPYKP